MIPHISALVGPVIDTSTQHRRLFFSLGNGEVQDSLLLTRSLPQDLEKYLNTCFRVACLLFDFVLQPTAHYYVSATRRVSLKNIPLFRDRVAAYVLGSDVEDYREDLEIKRREYPTRSNLALDYDNAKAVIEELKHLGPPLHRMGGIGTLTGEKWVQRIEGGFSLLLCETLQQECRMSSKQIDALAAFLRILPLARGYRAFDWHFIRDELNKAQFYLSESATRQLQKLLLNCYISASRDLYRGYAVGSAPSGDDFKRSARGLFYEIDVKFFLEFSQLIGLSSLLEGLSAADIVDIRRESLYLDGFRRTYFRLLDVAEESSASALLLLREELRREKKLQMQCLSELMKSSWQLLADAAKECGISQFCHAFAEPSEKGIYYFKAAMIELQELPLTAFLDELRVLFSKKLHIKAEEISRRVLSGRISFEDCTFLYCQLGSGNYLHSLDGDSRKEGQTIVSEEAVMSQFTFSGSTFEGCQFGDNNSMDNFSKALKNMDISKPGKESVIAKGLELRTEIEYSKELSKEDKIRVVNELLRLFQELFSESTSGEKNRLQDNWNQIKQGVQTSAHLTAIVMAFGKLLGFL